MRSTSSTVITPKASESMKGVSSVAIAAGEGFNVSILVGLAFAVAASANLPALLCALFWPRFNTAGAVTGVLGGLAASLILIALSPAVWPGPDSEGSPVPLANPALISFPIDAWAKAADSQAISLVGQMLASVVVTPFQVLMLTLLYFDLLARHRLPSTMPPVQPPV